MLLRTEQPDTHMMDMFLRNYDFIFYQIHTMYIFSFFSAEFVNYYVYLNISSKTQQLAQFA